jgi:hypothetical protein
MLLAANAFIIYFAIGVPFALLTVFVNRGRLEIQDVTRSFANLTLWPLIALRSVYLKFVNPASIESGNGDLTQLRTRLDETLSNGIPKDVKRELIFEFDRFEALSRELEALKTASMTPQPKILNAFRHPSPSIAAKCHSRRNTSILSQNLKQSSDSLQMLLKENVIEDDELSFEFTTALKTACQASDSH